jgi:transposase
MPRKVGTAIVTIGIDPGKNTMHLVGLDARGEIVLREKVARAKIVSRLANVPPCLIGIEAGMGTHYVTRELLALDHARHPCPTHRRPVTFASWKIWLKTGRRLDDRIEAVSGEIVALAQTTEFCRHLMTIPGIEYRSARPTTVLKSQLATHGRTIHRGQKRRPQQ